MLDLKAKLLAAGVVTAEQVKKVEDDEVARRDSDQQRRDAERHRREAGPAPRRDDRGPGGPRRDDRGPGGPPRRDDRGPAGPGGPPRGDRGPRRDLGDRGPRREPGSAPAVASDGVEGQAQPQQQPQGRPPRARDTRSFKERRVDENLEKRARREHEWTEAAKWRTRLDDLKAAGKTEQYEATRGWVMKERLDNKAITEAAEKFHFVSYAGTLSHLTVEPDLKARLSEGTAGIVGFVGYNGLEHAVVPADVAVDIKAVKSEWLRHLLGVTDIDPPPVRPPVEEGAVEGEPAVGEGSEGAVEAQADVGSDIADDIDNDITTDVAAAESVSENADEDGGRTAAPAVASEET